MILCVGQIVADVVVRPVGAMPARGTCDRVEELEVVCGGCAANTACVLAKLGSKASVAGLVGQDVLGSAALAEMARTGVDVACVSRGADVPTSAVIVLVESGGERSFLYREGGNEAFDGSSITDDVLAEASFVHIGGAMKLPMLDLAGLLGRAKARGCITSLDTDWDTHGRWLAALDPALAHVDHLMTNEEEGAMLTALRDPWQIAAKLLAMGPRTVIVKRGSLGAIILTSEFRKEFSAYPVRVKDATCAGDAFAAGFLHGLALEWPADESVRLGNAAGALCTTEISHRGITSFQAARQLLERYP